MTILLCVTMHASTGVLIELGYKMYHTPTAIMIEDTVDDIDRHLAKYFSFFMFIDLFSLYVLGFQSTLEQNLGLGNIFDSTLCIIKNFIHKLVKQLSFCTKLLILLQQFHVCGFV